MKRNDTRSLTVNGNDWEYKIGKNTIVVYDSNSKRHFIKFVDIVDISKNSNKKQLNPANILNYIYKNIEKNIKPNLCYCCNRRKLDVMLRVDPFEAEINQIYSKHFICDKCIESQSDAI
jgi:hypothetical protein